MPRIRRSGRRWRHATAVLVAACLTAAFSCSQDETLQISPTDASVSVAQGASASLSVSLELPTKRNLQSVALPANVQVVGPDSAGPVGVVVSANPGSVTISDRGSPVSTTLSIDALLATPPGDYTVIVRPSSNSKHLDPGPGLAINVTVVAGPAPRIEITSPQDAGFVAAKTLKIAANVTDAQGDFESWEILLDANSVKTGNAADAVSADADISAFGEGTVHTVEIDAKDTAGNMSTATAKFTIDRTAPDVTLTEPAEGTVVTGGTLHIAGTVADADFDHFELKLDDQLLLSGTTPGDVSFDLDTATVGDGAHTISLGAIDRAGNLTVKSVTITVDRGTPQPTPTSP